MILEVKFLNLIKKIYSHNLFIIALIILITTTVIFLTVKKPYVYNFQGKIMGTTYKILIAEKLPASLNQDSLFKLLNNLEQQLDCVVVMKISDQLIVNRLSNRRSCKECNQIYNLLYDPPKRAGKCSECNGDLFLREDDIPDTIQNRLNIYHQQTEPVIEYYNQRGIAEMIDAKGSIEEIRSQIIESISVYYN